MAGALILIIEDDEMNRKLTRDVLEVRGYRTIESGTGEEGIVLAREHAPSLVLLDIHLPGIDGLETFSRLREYPATASIPVVVVTASAMADDRVHVRAAGFDGFLAKPIEVRQLLDTVSGLVRVKDQDR